MQLYELEKRLTMNVKYLAKIHGVDMTKLYVNVQTSKGNMGHYSPNRWLMGDKKEKVDELALNPEFFDKPIEVVDTILHELVHVYCAQNEIKDTSRHGYYHNQKFKQVAESFGLVCIATESGWNTTSEGNEQKLETINSSLPYPITNEMIRRKDAVKKVTRERKKQHEYICPSCNLTIKHKDIIYILCNNCFGTLLEMDADDRDYEEWVSRT